MATNVKRKKKAEVMSDDGSMTLTGHLKELRNRLIICAAVFVVGVIGFLAISDKLIDLLTAMAMNANYTFVFLAPQADAVFPGVPDRCGDRDHSGGAVSGLRLCKTRPETEREILLPAGAAVRSGSVLRGCAVRLQGHPAVHAELPRHAGGYRLHHGIHQHRELHQPLPDHVHHLWLCV